LEKCTEIETALGDGYGPFAYVKVILDSLFNLSKRFSLGVDAVEQQLQKQLIQAIGSEVTPKQFTKYMEFHNRSLLPPAYAPQSFCFAIRRPNRFPEGTISIEQQGDLLSTLVRHWPAGPEQKLAFPINASTSIDLQGERYVHACLLHQFSGQSTSLSLKATARQFSSFIVLVGTVVSNSLFQPEFGVIIKDKDDLTIPLLLKTIPNAKEFADIIESLSPEQQEFCKSYRKLQLSATLFGVCIIQIKPQLEMVLNLPDGSLTKEIQLTQDLMEMFIEYQIPSDLVSYDGKDSADVRDKILDVKNNIAAIKAVIEGQKQKELSESKQRAESQFHLRMEESFQQSHRPQKSRSRRSPARSSSRSFSVVTESLASTNSLTSAVTPTSSPETIPTQPQEDKKHEVTPVEASFSLVDSKVDLSVSPMTDITSLPRLLDARYETADVAKAAHLRPTIISASTNWTKTSQAGLLSKPQTTTMSLDETKTAKRSAFDLLDCLSRSGALPMKHAELHVVIAATHCFDRTLLNTVVQRNVNPIAAMEKATMLLANTLYSAN
jgi:hypothetical protein